MSKKHIEPEEPFRSDASAQHPPIDKDLQLPHQVRRAAATADALVTGQPPVPIALPKNHRSEPKIALTDAQIDEAVQHLDRGDLKITGPYSATIIELAREGARHVKARRRGGKQPREASGGVTRRLGALIEAVRELSPYYKVKLTGHETIERLRGKLIKTLGLADQDETVSEETVRNDIRLVRPLLRLIQQGKFPPNGEHARMLQERTRREAEAGKRALARHAVKKR